MRKIFTIAAREYRAMVGTKAFMFSMLMMPLLMFGGIFAMDLLSRTGDIKDQKIVVIDHTQQLFDTLKLAALQHNQEVDRRAQADGDDRQPSGDQAVGEKQSRDSFGNFSKGQRFLLEKWPGEDIERCRPL